MHMGLDAAAWEHVGGSPKALDLQESLGQMHALAAELSKRQGAFAPKTLACRHTPLLTDASSRAIRFLVKDGLCLSSKMAFVVKDGLSLKDGFSVKDGFCVKDGPSGLLILKG